MVLPTFIIGGAQRSATTYLYEVCDAHPEIFMAKPRRPEPKFFSVDEEFQAGIDYYARKYFAHASGFPQIGEKSTSYLENPNAPGRIYRCLPDVKLIFVLRNPIERAFSNYLFSCLEGLEKLSFEDALACEGEREESYEPAHRYARPFSYVSRGMYATLLGPYFSLLAPAQIRIFLLGDIIRDPQAAACQLFEFLGLPMIDLTVDLAQKVNSARLACDRIPQSTYEFLRRIYAEPNAELSELIGRDLSRWDRPRDAVDAYQDCLGAAQ